MIGPTQLVEVYSVTRDRDAYGAPLEGTPVLKAKIKAVLSNPSSKTKAYANSPAMIGEYIMYTNFLNIESDDKIKINNEWYRIIGIRNPNSRNHHLEVTLEKYAFK